jgi:predicted O-methyltransferase YrrM
LELFFNKNLSLISRICERYVFFQLPETVIPKLDLSQVMDRKVRIEIREPRGVDGNISLLELMVLNKLVRLAGPVNVLEIGTFDGRTTLNLAANSPDNARVYTLDLPADQLDAAQLPLTRGERRYIRKATSGAKYRGTDCERKISQLYGDSAAFDFSPYVEKMDFIFIDGSHSYEYVLNDSKICLNLLNKTKGIIVWHDYMKWQGVTRALNELYLNVPEFQGMRNINGTSLVCLINN